MTFLQTCRFSLVLLIVGAVCAGQTSRSLLAVEAAALAKAVESVTIDELRKHAEFLADDTLEGREAGSRGGQAAANYLTKEFARQGLSAAGENRSYFQGFNGSCRNILGMIEGSDPQLKQQVIVLGAHYDHVGYGRKGNSYGPIGYIHNGADDNASGVSGLLEIIDAIKRLPTAPKRSILFALWDAEEVGLIGSRHWISRPTVPLSRVALCFNIDMIGRLKDQRLEVFGSRTLAGSRRVLSETNTAADLTLDFNWQVKADSDHHPFFAQGIPFLMLHTGLHENYHRPSDDANLLNLEGMQQVTRLMLQTLLRYADGEDLGKFRAASQQENNFHRDQMEQPQQAQPPRFGLPWLRAAGDELRIVMLPPTPGSPAEAAGLRAGDRLVKCEGAVITDENLLRLQLMAAAGKKTLTIEREGEKEPLEISITPRGGPIRVGISWRDDPAEPGSVLLTQVIPGSAATLAGLAVGDRIQAIGGQRFANGDELGRLIATLPSPLEVIMERRGRLRVVKVETLPAEIGP
ncbi:MAG: M20/M25/M40 family metallo-hydrolase [Pirellulaceae bacterium]|nr:M20/M25/M40 family metallo-hydrolase [Pirellulaceae bacterium]